MSKIARKFLDYFSFLLAFTAMLLVLFEYLTHANFIRNIFNISYTYFFIFASLFFFFYWIFKCKKEVYKNWKTFIFLLPLFLMAGALIIYMRRFFFFLELEKEDGVIETMQTILLFADTLLCGYLAQAFWKRNKILSTLFLLATLVFFVMAGEEISWGQRIFDIRTPENLVQINTQGEINIHNNKAVWHYVYKGYAAIGFIGSTTWTFKKVLAKNLQKNVKTFAETLIPDWQYIFYFLTAFLYNLQIHILNPSVGSKTGSAHWEEPMELLLYIGITLFLFEKYMRKKQYVKNEP